MPTENKYEVNETIIRFYIVRAWSFGPRPVRQSCFTLDPPLTIDQVINKWSNTTVVPYLTVEGQTVTSNRAIAASMNEYFCNIGNKLSKKIPEQRTPSCVVNTLDTPLPFLIPIGFCFGLICHNLLI